MADPDRPKFVNSEDFEARRCDENLERLRRASLKSQSTLSLLNTGQQMIIAAALVAMLWRATLGVTEGRLTLGDLVMINAFMIQLYIPINFLGVMYREIKQAEDSVFKRSFSFPVAPRARRDMAPDALESAFQGG